MLTIDYTQSKPIVDITVADLSNKNTIDLKAVVDTGASVTCLPQTIINQMLDGQFFVEEGEPVTASGALEKKTLRTFIVNIVIEGCSFEEINVVPINRNVALVGQDILKKCSVTFDGIKQQIRVEESECSQEKSEN